MCPDLVVIGRVILQNATQGRFVGHHQVVETFAPDRADETLDGKPIHTIAPLIQRPTLSNRATRAGGTWSYGGQPRRHHLFPGSWWNCHEIAGVLLDRILDIGMRLEKRGELGMLR